MKAHGLRAAVMGFGDDSVVGVSIYSDAFYRPTSGLPDALIMKVTEVDLAPLRAIRSRMPEIPVVLVADAKIAFDEKKPCTTYGPLVIVREPEAALVYDRVMPALYAAVPGSIAP